jgi:hypothetical protein
MKRFLTLLLSLALILTVAGGKTKQKPPCAANIGVCAPGGCSPDNHHDAKLNVVKNIEAPPSADIEDRTLTWMKNLEDPEQFSQGDDRDELTELGEGHMIRVVAYLLIARDEPGGESCNCYLHDKEQTDNHLVLVSRTTVDKFPSPSGANATQRKAILAQRELESETAEYTPRVRKNGHPDFLKATIQPLIDSANQKALKVRVTGQLMFDSEHFIRNHLHRVNNWEIHPVFKMEYCTTGASCKAKSDAGWKSIDDQ